MFADLLTTVNETSKISRKCYWKPHDLLKSVKEKYEIIHKQLSHPGKMIAWLYGCQQSNVSAF